MENAATKAHFARLRQGRIDTAETSALHLDIIRDLKRINSHLVAGAAYPVARARRRAAADAKLRRRGSNGGPRIEPCAEVTNRPHLPGRSCPVRRHAAGRPG